MSKERKPIVPEFTIPEPVLLKAEPEPLPVDLKRMAVLVIDMQNAFVSQGGMFDLMGFDISNASRIIDPIKKIRAAAREKQVRVIYIAHVLYPDLRELGPMSKFGGMTRAHKDDPKMRDKTLLRGSWGAQIVNELKPQEDEMLFEKRRYSAFVGTDLDIMLRSWDIRYLAFCGVATNICVESSLRDACHLEYLPVLVSDAAAAAPPSRQEATIGNVRQCFGWVTTTEDLLNAMK